MAGLRGDRRRRVHGRPRPVDRERGVPVDPPVVPRGLDGHAVVGPRRLQRRVRRAAPRGGQDRRPLRTPAHLPARPADLHRRVAAVRHRALGVAAHRRPGRPGHRCGPADAGLARPAAVRDRRRRRGPRRWRCGAAWPRSRSPPAPRSARSSSTPAGGAGRSSSTSPSRSSPASPPDGSCPNRTSAGRFPTSSVWRCCRPRWRPSPWRSPRAVTGAGRAVASSGPSRPPQSSRPSRSAGQPATSRRPSTSTCSSPARSCSPTPPRSCTRSASSGCCWPTSCS